MSTNGPLSSRQGRDHFFGMSASMWRKRESSLYPQASFFLILFLEIISVDSESVNYEEKNVSIEKTYAT